VEGGKTVANERILVVDDQPAVVEVCTEILAEAGYQVFQACGGREALARLEEVRFDLLVVDLWMPEVDGLTVLRRACELDPEVTSIVITSYGSIENAIEALRAGAQDFLRKPFDPDDLLRAVGKALAAHKREQEHLLLRVRLPLLEISQALMAEGNVESLANHLLEVVTRQSGAEQAALLLLDQGADHLRLVAAVPQGKMMAEMQVSAGEGIARQAMLAKEPLLAKASSLAGEGPLSEVLPVGPETAAAYVPLRAGEKTIGLLALSRAGRAGSAPFSPSDLNLLSIMGSQIATALENTRLIEALRRELGERVRAEEALHENEEKYRAVADFTYDWEYWLGPNGRYIYVSPSCERITGYRAEEFLQDPALLERIVHVDDRALVVDHLKQGILHDSDHTFDFRVITRGGEERWIGHCCQSVYDRQGQYLGQRGSHRDITERKRAEEALEQSEQRKTILNQIANVFLTVPDDEMYAEVLAVVLQVTKSKFGTFGFIGTNNDLIIPSLTREIWKECQVPGKTIVFAPDTWGDSLWGRAIREKKAFYSEGPFHTPEGHIHIDNFLVAPIVFGGEAIGIISVANNEWGYSEEDKDLLESIVSHIAPILNARLQRDQQEQERKRAEEALRESERLLAEIAANYPNSYLSIIEKDLTIGFTSGQEFKRRSLDPKSFEGLSLEQVFGEHTPTVRAHYLKTFQGEETSFELFIDNQHQLYQTVPLHDKNGQITRILAVVENITERKQAEKEMQRSNDLLRAIVEAAPTAIIGLDLDGNVQMVWNPAAEKMLGWSAQEAMGHPLPSVPMESQEEFRGFRERIRSGLTLDGVDVRRQRRDGSPIDYSIYASPLHDAEGRITGNLAVLVDITERKRNDAINASRLHLMQFAVTHSLDELLEETLNEAEKLADSLIGFYHFVEDDQESLTLQNWSTRTKAEFCRAEGKGLHYAIDKAGVWVDCVYQRKPVVHNDYASFPRRKGMPEGHAEVVRELVVPVLRGEKIKAILGVGNKPSDYTAQDVEAVALLANLAWEIAERKMAEEKMLRSDQRLRLHSEQSPLGFLEWDDNFHAVEWNAACERIFGYTREEAIGRHAKDLILPPEVHELVDGIYHSLMNQTGGQHSINENVTKDGRIIICEWFNTTLINKDGQAIGVASVCRDITEKKQAEEALREKQNQLLEAQHIAHIGNWWHDLVTGEIYWSDEFFRIIGLEPQKPTTELAVAITHPDDWHIVQRAMDEAAAGKVEHEHEFRIIRPDGGICWIHNRWVGTYDEAGKEIKRVGTHQDITERKQAEEKLQEYREHLEELVAARTAQLEAKTRELETFAYSVSHDLKAPLRGIDGYSRLLLEDHTAQLDDEGRTFLHIIRSAANQMDELINDLLDYSRLERRSMHTMAIDLPGLVEAVIAEFAADIEQRGVDLGVDVSCQTVTAEAEGLAQALRNVVSNALKFTRDVPLPQIEIGGRETEKACILWVRDNGTGFDMQYHDRIFEIFQRLYRSEDYPGTGVGLAIVRKAMQRMGGRVWAESAPGQGATFYLEIPVETGRRCP
jgi:PAS domain S-box-containing protein